MSTPVWQNRLYANLLRESQRGPIQRHCAYLAAGWLSLFLIRPKFEEHQAASFSAIAGGGVLLVLVLLLAGPLLNAMQPVLKAAGQAPSLTWPVAAVIALFAWRYTAGRKLLHTFAALKGAA
ncbi:hypothetical protein [Burkholderia ubonensis]|uniref:hypothetical protein n=1 Tax=Burkholderia ubonensis TaxID=101571 RepID=UPI00075640C0|nr:hypothetical protein [Burkholderia ubonensis]KVP17371.1 hypothetical protein WJ84_03840 [Burkholderia ubonensis]KVP39507.1 hypothetical protein WJ87_04530 [Burkholderia ubonensis]